MSIFWNTLHKKATALHFIIKIHQTIFFPMRQLEGNLVEYISACILLRKSCTISQIYSCSFWLCFVSVKLSLLFDPCDVLLSVSTSLHWHCGNHTLIPVKQPRRLQVNFVCCWTTTDLKRMQILRCIIGMGAIWMIMCTIVASPLLMHWIHHSLALSHRVVYRSQ